MKKINLLALLICACLLMSCFAACSHSNVTVDSDNETSITENESFREEWAQSEDAYQAARLLLQLRNEQNLTQSELALLSSKKQSYIARIESGHYNVSFKVLNEIVQSAGRKLDIRLK